MTTHSANRTSTALVASIFVVGLSVWLVANWADEPGKLSDPSWAGQYEASASYESHFLSITEQGRFVDEEDDHCTGARDGACGTVDETEGRLELKSRAAAGMRLRRLPAEYLMIRWGKRRYLIPPEEIFDFCAEVRGGCEPRCKGEGNFLLHQGDEKIEPDADELQLPERFRKYLRMRQLEVGIKTLARNSEVSIPMRAQGVQLEYAVTVDAGSAEGVLPRMRFRKPPPSWGGELVVAETSLHESKGVLAIQSAGGPSFIEPKVGERFRTPGPTHCSSPRVFPLAGKVTVDGGPPPQGGGWQIVVMLDDQTESMPYRSFAECQPDGRFSFSKYKANDGTKVGSYVVLIASLQRDKLDQIYSEHLVGPDRFNNLYNDPAVNARRPGFVIEHQKPGRTDYVFDLKTRGAEPNKRPGPRALTETAR